MKENDHIPEDLSVTAEQAKRKINHEFSASKKWSVGCFIGAAAAGLFSAAAAEVNQDELALASMGSGIVGAPMVAVTKYSRARNKSKKIISNFYLNNNIPFDGVPSQMKTIVTVRPDGSISETRQIDYESYDLSTKHYYFGLGALALTPPAIAIADNAEQVAKTPLVIAGLGWSVVGAISLYLARANANENASAYCRQIDNLANGNLAMEIQDSETKE